MSQKININQHTFIRIKRGLQMSLEKQGVCLSLNQVSTVLAQCFGFKNEEEMQENYFNKIVEDDIFFSYASSNVKRNEKEIDIINIMEKTKKDYLINKNFYNNYEFIEIIYRCSNRQSDMLKDFFKHIDKDKKGHVMISGCTGSGKSEMVRIIMENNNNLVSLETLKNAGSYHEIEDISDINLIETYSNNNIIFSFPGCDDCLTTINRFKLMDVNEVVLKNIKYVIHLRKIHY